MDNATPMLRQYLEIKKQYPGTILFFRLGDFYEMFNEDAIVGSRELEITLTARQKDTPNPIPMCGVPYHAAAGYIARLVRKGYRIAICEQAEEAKKGVKLVRREVVRVITPGTAIDPQLTEQREPVYIAALDGSDNIWAAALMELSAGRLTVLQSEGPDAIQRISEQVGAFSPKELICDRKSETAVRAAFNLAESDDSELFPEQPEPKTRDLLLTVREDHSDAAAGEERLKDHFGVATLESFGIAGKVHAISAAAACLSYARETQMASADHITDIEYLEAADHMILDPVTLENLELVESRNRSGTLFSLIDETVTGMGSRLLRGWLLRPSLKRSEIQTRQGAVSELSDTILRERLRFLMKAMGDLERLLGRLNLGTATPRDIVALRNALERTPDLHEALSDAQSLLLQVLAENIYDLPDLVDLISSAISDEPPVNLADGHVIKEGFNAELDELRSISTNAKQTIAGFESEERIRTGITSLKVRFNNVFGYYIEVPKAQILRVPEGYERRQTLANAERYTTPELKEWEQKVLSAEDRIIRLEADLFHEVRDRARSETRRISSTARAVATLDALAALAETASHRNYVCPVLHDGDLLEIRHGRHPVVEASLRDNFVPNDVLMNNSTDRLLIITGANMGGKSTILRQIALIQVLAQIGSFVPAASAKLPIVDRIWTRVGASDDLASGRSTFMVEMSETAAILRNATPRSLVVLDEIGRGTSTFDGLSIAWAVAEYLHDSPEHAAKTIFATHYHELTELAEALKGAKNYQITATENDGEIVFFHKLQPGAASKSYGIAVAKLAGIPRSVVDRAREVLSRLEQYELAVFGDNAPKGIDKAASKKEAAQASLFSVVNDAVIDEIRNTDISVLSPDEAHRLLVSVKERLI